MHAEFPQHRADEPVARIEATAGQAARIDHAGAAADAADDRSITLPGPGGRGLRRLESENDLLSIMPDADGVKTGHTDNAGYTLVAHATSGTLGRQLYAVLMGEPDRATRASDAKALLEWGFAHYARPVVVPRGQAVVSLDVQGVPGATVPLAPPSAVVTQVSGTGVVVTGTSPSTALPPVVRSTTLERSPQGD